MNKNDGSQNSKDMDFNNVSYSEQKFAQSLNESGSSQHLEDSPKKRTASDKALVEKARRKKTELIKDLEKQQRKFYIQNQMQIGTEQDQIEHRGGIPDEDAQRRRRSSAESELLEEQTEVTKCCFFMLFGSRDKKYQEMPEEGVEEENKSSRINDSVNLDEQLSKMQPKASLKGQKSQTSK